jgi:hypothetical protein
VNRILPYVLWHNLSCSVFFLSHWHQ